MTNTAHDPLGLYSRTPLPRAGRATRFLTFERRDGQILGSLQVYDIDDVGLSWIALSYTWSVHPDDKSGTAHGSITVDGVHMSIGMNLCRALHTLLDERDKKPSARRAFKARRWSRSPVPDLEGYFWIDAICIDQSDIAERSSQVPLMKDVYERARSVIAWLTPMPTSPSTPGGVGASLIRDVNIPEVMNNMYWTRMWMVQEIILPRDFVVLYQSTWIHPMYLFRIKEITRMNFELYTLLWSRKDYHAKDADRATASTEPPGTKLTFNGLISGFCHQQCENPRDKIYGLLGLFPQGYNIRPDYTKLPLEVFTDTVYAQVEFWDVQRQWLDANRSTFRRSDDRRWAKVAPSDGWKGILAHELDISWHPVVQCVCDVPMEQLPRRASPEDSTLTTLAIWLVHDEAGQAQLKKMVRKTSQWHVPRSMNAKMWDGVEDLRSRTGLPTVKFREIFKDTPFEKLYDPSSSEQTPWKLADYYLGTPNGQTELRDALLCARFDKKGTIEALSGLLLRSTCDIKEFWDLHAKPDEAHSEFWAGLWVALDIRE